MPHISAVMMLKNEKKRLHVTLESIKNVAESIIVFDTGSTDNTIEIVRDFCTKNAKNLYLKEGIFVNFEESRNELLDFADSHQEPDWYLLLDCNDELKYEKNSLQHFLKNFNDIETFDGFQICQQWWNGKDTTKYFNIRLIKARSGWQYKGVVHEYLYTDHSEKIGRIPDDLFLYQDRTSDDDKTGKRFLRDYDMLLEEYKKDPTEPRTVFYLAQTCSCLELDEEAIRYYTERYALEEGFFEERYESALRVGNTMSRSELYNWDEILIWYMKALEISPRAEAAIKIATHYINIDRWMLAYTFAKVACSIDCPDYALFSDKLCYDYERWHILGRAAYYMGHMKEGLEACKKAIHHSNKDIDKHNMQFYIRRMVDEEKESKILKK